MNIPAKYRQYIYPATVALLAVLFALNIVRPEVVSDSLEQAAILAGIITNLLAGRNVNLE